MTDESFVAMKTTWTPLMKRISNRWRATFSVQDCEQIADIALWKAVNKFDQEKSSFKTYLYNFLEWEFSNVWRKERCKVKTVSIEALAQKSLTGPNFVPLDLSSLDKPHIVCEDMAEEIERRLAGNNKEVFSLLKNGNSLAQVSDIMGVSRQRVSQIFKRICKSSLIERMRKEYE